MNITKYKKAIKSLSWLWIGSLLGGGSTFLVYRLLARKLGPNLFGIFSNVLTISLVFSILTGFGVSRAWLKLFGSEGWKAIRWVKPSLRFLLITFIFVILIVAIFTTLEINDALSNKLLILMTFHVLGYSIIDLVCSKLQLEENYRVLALWQLLPNLLRLIIIASGFYLFQKSVGIINVGWVYLFIGLLFALLGIRQILKMGKGEFLLKGHEKNIEDSQFTVPTIKNVIMEAWPFGLGGFFAFFYVQSDIIMVKYIVGNEQAGLYNASFIILNIIYTFPSILYQKFLLPKFHRWANQDPSKFYSVYSKGNRIMFLSGVVMLILVILTSDVFIPLIFGDEYLASIKLINILAITLPFQLVAFSVESTLVTKNNMKKKVKYMGYIAIFNIVLNLYLVPKYQAMGAAIATVLSNALLLGVYFFGARKHVFNDK